MPDRKDGSFDNIRVFKQCIFNFTRRDLLPTSFDDLLCPTNDEQISIPIKVTEVAGSKPAIAKRQFGSDGIIFVAARDGRTVQRDFSLMIRRQVFAVLIE